MSQAPKAPVVNPEDVAVAFLTLASSGNVREAYNAYAAPGFRHYHPYFRGDAASLMAGMAENARANPNKVLAVQRVLRDGETVAVHHIKQHPADRGRAAVHILRFEGGRIAELWDVGQAVPETSPNDNGMF